MNTEQILNLLADLLVDFQKGYPEYSEPCEELRTVIINKISAIKAEAESYD